MVDRLRKLARLRTARYDTRLKGIYLGEGVCGAGGLARVGGGGHVERLGVADLGEQARLGRVEGHTSISKLPSLSAQTPQLYWQFGCGV